MYYSILIDTAFASCPLLSVTIDSSLSVKQVTYLVEGLQGKALEESFPVGTPPLMKSKERRKMAFTREAKNSNPFLHLIGSPHSAAIVFPLLEITISDTRLEGSRS